MAQAGYTPLSLYYSTTGSAVPVNTNLVNGELAINIADGKLYYKDNTGTVQLLASKAGASGDVVGPASATDNAVVRFDGTTGKLVQNSAVTIADTTGDITGGAYNKVTITAPASSATLTIANGKTLTANATLTLAGTDATTMTFPSTSASIARTDAGQTFTGDQVIAGNLTMNAQGDVRFADSDSSNWVAFQGPATVASNVTWTLPNADGTSGQFLSTDGAGILSWATASGGGGGGGTSVTVTQITATASQTTFNVTYTVGQISVYLNGALLASADYTATNGTSVVLGTGAASGDIFTAVVYSSVTQIIQGDTSVTVSDSGSNGTITFTTDNSERMRVTSGGSLVIGTTTNPTTGGFPVPLFFGKQLNNTSAWSGFQLESSADTSVLGLGFDGTSFKFATSYRTTGDYRSIVIAPISSTPCATFNTDQTVKFNTVISVGNATPTTSGAGITFPATQSASTDANTLDDYEEGTWTPVSSFSGGNGTRTDVDMKGRYTKIGRCVTIVMYTQITKGTASGNLSITGLPFTIGSTGSYVLGVPVASGSLTGVSGLVFGYGSAPGTSLAMYYTGTGTAATITDAQMQANNSTFYSSFLYYID